MRQATLGSSVSSEDEAISAAWRARSTAELALRVTRVFLSMIDARFFLKKN